MSFRIEWAQNADGEMIRCLLAADGLHIHGANWADIAGYWLVARVKGRIAACIQVAFAKPISRLEFLTVDKGYTGLSRARIAQAMLKAAIGVCQVRGATFASGHIPYNRDYTDILVRRGGQIINEGFLVIGGLEELKHGRLKDDGLDQQQRNAGRDRVPEAAD